MTNNQSRQQQAYEVRVAAAEIALRRTHPQHIANGDEHRFRREKDGKNVPSFFASFTKGLPHDEDTGLVDEPASFLQFVRAIDSGDSRDFRDTPLGNEENYGWDHWKCNDFEWKSKKARTGGDNGDPVPVRAWESQGAGSTFDLEGPDAQAVTMLPAPTVGSDELTAEMGEVYVQALLRDVPFAAMSLNTTSSQADAADRKKVSDHVELLNKLDWFGEQTGLSPDEVNRYRSNLAAHTAFRGITPGDEIGPYLSQFMLAGNAGFGAVKGIEEHPKSKGLISYGAITVDQRVRFAKTEQDYMTFWSEWLDSQNGADLRGWRNTLINRSRDVSSQRLVTWRRTSTTTLCTRRI